MPNLNGKGPNGNGTITGRGLGTCEMEIDEKKEIQTVIRRGLGRNQRKLDGTGPNGKGPLTGRGSGNCK